MPSQIQFLADGIGRLGGQAAQSLQHDVQVSPMQHVQFGKRQPPTAHFFHGALVLTSPGIREGWPVGLNTQWRQNTLRLTGHR
jgi:hypothetical protein